MDAINVTVGFDEWKKVEDFAELISDEATFVYQVDNVQLLIVTDGIYSMDYVKALIARTFDDADIEVLR